MVFLYIKYLPTVLYSSVYLYSMYNLGGRKPKKKVSSLQQQQETLAMFKIPDRNVVVVCMVY